METLTVPNKKQIKNEILLEITALCVETPITITNTTCGNIITNKTSMCVNRY